MKNITVIIFVLLINSLFSQNCVTETSVYRNGKTYTIIDFDTIHHNMCGIYKEYDSTGVLLIDGNYIGVDSIKCKDCFNDDYSENRLEGKWTKYDYIDCRELKVGIWKYYHPNGKLKMIGEYLNVVHAYNGMSYPLSWEGKSWPSPRNVYIDFEYLKKGQWEYYDENGNNYLTEEYANGSLIFKIERN